MVFVIIYLPKAEKKYRLVLKIFYDTISLKLIKILRK